MPPKRSAPGAIHRLHGVGIGNVDLYGEPIDALGHGRRSLDVHVGDDDPRTFFGEQLCSIGAHASAGTRDHADLAVETSRHVL